jgi:AP-2 complex subunit alpha
VLQGLTVYETKKYVWKMLYIYMLGYDVEFGHMETVSLISAPKYPEKQVRFRFLPSISLRRSHWLILFGVLVVDELHFPQLFY